MTANATRRLIAALPGIIDRVRSGDRLELCAERLEQHREALLTEMEMPTAPASLIEAARGLASWMMAGETDGQQVKVNVDAWQEWLRRRRDLRDALAAAEPEPMKPSAPASLVERSKAWIAWWSGPSASYGPPPEDGFNILRDLAAAETAPMKPSAPASLVERAKAWVAWADADSRDVVDIAPPVAPEAIVRDLAAAEPEPLKVTAGDLSSPIGDLHEVCDLIAAGKPPKHLSIMGVAYVRAEKAEAERDEARAQRRLAEAVTDMADGPVEVERARNGAEVDRYYEVAGGVFDDVIAALRAAKEARGTMIDDERDKELRALRRLVEAVEAMPVAIDYDYSGMFDKVTLSWVDWDRLRDARNNAIRLARAAKEARGAK